MPTPLHASAPMYVQTCLKTILANSSDREYDNYVESYLSIINKEIRQLIGQGDYRYLGSVFGQGLCILSGLWNRTNIAMSAKLESSLLTG